MFCSSLASTPQRIEKKRLSGLRSPLVPAERDTRFEEMTIKSNNLKSQRIKPSAGIGK
jgi:hypothetical protein